MLYRGLILFAALALVACASGPHPALQLASSDLDCEQSGMKLHQIYPKKVRVEGCGQEAIYVDACNGYGVDSTCGWGRQYATEFERDAAERAKAERAEAKKQQARDKKAEEEQAMQAEQEAAEAEAAEKEKAEHEKVAKADEADAEKEKAAAAKAEEESAEDEKVAAKKPDEEEAEGDDAKPKADAKKPEAKNAKRGKKSDDIDDFLK
jgi:flagellar biosynthesis GTPase FlhF